MGDAARVIDGLILIGDEAWTPEEYEAAKRRRSYTPVAELTPEQAEVMRARRRAYAQRYRFRNRDARNAYNREWMRRKRHGIAVRYIEMASLHDLRCTGPTKATGCRCSKVRVPAGSEA